MRVRENACVLTCERVSLRCCVGWGVCGVSRRKKTADPSRDLSSSASGAGGPQRGVRLPEEPGAGRALPQPSGPASGRQGLAPAVFRGGEWGSEKLTQHAQWRTFVTQTQTCLIPKPRPPPRACGLPIPDKWPFCVSSRNRKLPESGGNSPPCQTGGPGAGNAPYAGHRLL